VGTGHTPLREGKLRPVPGEPEPAFSHLGVCVSDLDRSVRFYCEALGFEKAESHAIGSEFAALMDFAAVELTSQFVRRGSTAIELLSFTEPVAFGDRERRAVNQLGLTHLSFRVHDVAATVSRIVDLGGSVVESSRTVLDLGGTELEFVYCTDPDGVRIELMDLGD
jgi:catechol 2,3-dioxygenase-like lactoylglutathione lyase family enzyme